MFSPFVLPEGLVGTVLVLPVDVHEVQDIVTAGCLEDLGDVRVLAGLIAVLVEGAIAVVRPVSSVNYRGLIHKKI